MSADDNAMAPTVNSRRVPAIETNAPWTTHDCTPRIAQLAAAIRSVLLLNVCCIVSAIKSPHPSAAFRPGSPAEEGLEAVVLSSLPLRACRAHQCHPISLHIGSLEGSSHKDETGRTSRDRGDNLMLRISLNLRYPLNPVKPSCLHT